MTEDEVRQRAFAMPLTSPAYPKGPYRFVDREYLIFTYRSDPTMLEKIVPAPLKLHEPLVKFEFMKMPDSTGFGDYCESGQVIPVSFQGQVGGYQHAMYLNDHAPIAGGRELWGFPKKLGCPDLRVHKDTLVGTLDFNGIRIATGTMGYKHKLMDSQSVFDALSAPTFLDHSPRGWGAANLRARVLYFAGPHHQRRLERTRGAGTLPSRPGANRRIAGLGSGFGCSYPDRSYPPAGRGRLRLFGGLRPAKQVTSGYEPGSREGAPINKI